MLPEHDRLLARLALVGATCALFQCWLAYVVSNDDAAFLFCRFTTVLDCTQAVQKHGPGLLVAGIAVLPALAALFLFQLGVLVSAGQTSEAQREGLGAWARVATLPTTGLCLYTILDNILVAKATSLSGLLMTGAAIWGVVITLTHGVRVAGLKRTAKTGTLLLVAAAACGHFLGVAGTARLELRAVRADLAAQPTQVRFPRFASAIPRTGAAVLGPPNSMEEVLVFLDPAQKESRDTLAGLLESDPKKRHVVYVTGPHAAGLVVAQKFGFARAYLEQLAKGSDADPGTLIQRLGGDPTLLESEETRMLVERQRRRLAVIDTFPTLWDKDGRR